MSAPKAGPEPVDHNDIKGLFRKRLLVYVPAHNCADAVGGVIKAIPPEVAAAADILVVDNFSYDGTGEAAAAACSAAGLKDAVLLRTSSDLGYAGSQKLAYRLALASPSVEWVLMLHGDGQYPPELTRAFLPYMDSDFGVCYGYRSKRLFREEETPWSTWAIIKGLSLLESLVTGVFRREWHTGFVMYRTSFLRRLDLGRLTHTPHIDGNLLYLSGALGVKTAAVPIYKRYRELTPFEGAARRRYVLDVLRLMFRFRMEKEAAQGPDSGRADTEKLIGSVKRPAA